MEVNPRIVPPEEHRKRLDQVLAVLEPSQSRTRWKALVEAGKVRVNGLVVMRPSHEVRAGDVIQWEIPPPAPSDLVPENIPINILYEDPYLLAVDKPAGMVVHPAAGHERGTLVNALLFHRPELSGVGGERRPGIVHRLDRDTSGVLLIAKTDPTHRALSEMFKQRQIRKEYLALVFGAPEPPVGKIETLIGRSPSHRKKMSARVIKGRIASTSYRVLSTNDLLSLLCVEIQTGRTHQIRVHMAHLGHPVVGDLVYGQRKRASEEFGAKRQMLHAWRLKFVHPITFETLEIESPIAEDFSAVVQRAGLSLASL